VPGIGEILIRVSACGVCRTDLHVADGELPEPKLPLIPGHEIVGVVVKQGPCAGRFDIGQFSYAILWGERTVRSIANLTRLDGDAFFDIVPKAGIITHVETFFLEAANEAMHRLRSGLVRGAVVLLMDRHPP
jgi:D-arabinose 1-dehydrogenase-like Zn-dependent alcohol dehydrogenase